MQSILVCLVGMDGSGKTTLAKRVVEEMQARGIRSRYVWGGFDPTILLRPAIWLVKSLIYREERHSHISDQKGQVLRNKTFATMYHYVVLADHVLQIATRVHLPLLLGCSVVCDRYVHDAVITTALVLDYPDSRLLRLLEQMDRLAPRPDRVLVADLPEEIAYERKDDIPSIAFLEERRRRYRLVAEAHGLPVLDARQPLGTLVEHTIAEVLQLCQGKPLSCKYS